MMTDACSVIHDQDFPRPTAPYVWLGASVEPGTRDLGGGWQQTTVEVGGSTVTGATQDDSLSEQILATRRGREDAGDRRRHRRLRRHPHVADDAELNVATTAPWAVDGIRRTSSARTMAPRGLSDYFRGILG